MDRLFDIAIGAFLVFAVWFFYLWARKGWAWGLAKLQAWWSAGKSDLYALKLDFSDLVSRVTALERDAAAKNTPAEPPPPQPAPEPVKL